MNPIGEEMNNLKISTRIVVLTGLMSLLLMIIGGLGLFGMQKSNAGVENVYRDNTVPLEQIAVLQERFIGSRLAIAVALVTPDEQTIRSSVREVEDNVATVLATWKAYSANLVDPKVLELASSFETARARYAGEGLLPAIQALRANDIPAARQIALERLRPMYEPIQAATHALQRHYVDSAQREFDASIARYGQIRAVSITSIVLGVAFAALFGFFLIRGISRSLNHAVQASNAVAEGDLTVHIDAQGRDEVAELLRALLTMKESLARVVGQVRADAEGVALASTQIAQGNLDLSSRTEEQASALEETAASMEELSATIRQNADNAGMADQLAKGASTVATQGGQVVGEVIETMKGINDSSRRIADIIGVIDGIAFQTNILALNAAVEAARAGEQGRGFAVVASEVRNLAQRSAEAAKEIKELITASVDQVTHGAELVDKAGETMAEVVQSIVRVSDIMGEINSASAEQSSGVAQVTEAVSQMDHNTQQNAALVEESAAAAESLKEQAKHLVQAVAVFRLGHGDAVHAGATRSAGAAFGEEAGEAILQTSAAATASSALDAIRRRASARAPGVGAGSGPRGSQARGAAGAQEARALAGASVAKRSAGAADDEWQSF